MYVTYNVIICLKRFYEIFESTINVSRIICISITKFDWSHDDHELARIYTVRIFREPRASVNPPVAAVAHDKMTGAKPGWIRMADRTDQKDV